MKAKMFFAFLIVILTSCTSVSPRADNFSFVFKYAPCGSNPLFVLDTTNNMLIHTPPDATNSLRNPFVLTESELESIYEKAISIDFFDYPQNFVIPDDQVIGYKAPALSYELSITNGKMSNSVIWNDNNMTKPDYTKADKLRELMNLIYEIIQSHPNIPQFPEQSLLCA
jgi:hypothetical protein